MLAANTVWTGTTELPKSSKDGLVLLYSAISVIQSAGGLGPPQSKPRPANADVVQQP